MQPGLTGRRRLIMWQHCNCVAVTLYQPTMVPGLLLILVVLGLLLFRAHTVLLVNHLVGAGYLSVCHSCGAQQSPVSSVCGYVVLWRWQSADADALSYTLICNT